MTETSDSHEPGLPVARAVEDPSGREPRADQGAGLLSQGQVEALLAELEGDGSVLGRRDYALLLCLLRTAQRPKQVRTLRWGAIGAACGVAWVAWPRAGRVRREQLPADAWMAIQAYLEVSGRLPGIAAEHYIFAALADPGAPTVGRAAEWQADAPLSSEHLSCLLKRRLEGAGLDVGPFTSDDLRRTAVMLRVSAGATRAEIQAWLGHLSHDATRDYIRSLQARPPSKARRQVACRSLWKAPVERPDQGGNRALLDARLGPPAGEWPLEAQVAPQEQPISLQQALANLQVILGRVFQEAKKTRQAGELLHFTELFSRTTMRLAVLKGNLQRDREDELRAAIDIALREVTAEMRESGRLKIG